VKTQRKGDKREKEGEKSKMEEGEWEKRGRVKLKN